MSKSLYVVDFAWVKVLMHSYVYYNSSLEWDLDLRLELDLDLCWVLGTISIFWLVRGGQGSPPPTPPPPTCFFMQWILCTSWLCKLIHTGLHFASNQQKPSLFLILCISYTCQYHHSTHLAKSFKFIYTLNNPKSEPLHYTLTLYPSPKPYTLALKLS